MNTVTFVILLLLLLIVIVLAVPFIRTRLLTSLLFKRFKKILPQMSNTERDAIEAGTVWWEAELYCGNPNWDRLLNFPKPELSTQEQAFLDNQVSHVCSLVNDWKVTHHDGDISTQTWDYLKKEGFFGMIIPKTHGGLGFSAFAHSEVVSKLSTHSSALAVTVMVPNSLGPSELLLHYGTERQKKYYLPRLANGEEIPAFALTSPWAGSDAAAIPDYGVVCQGEWQGQQVLGMRVTWDKRYITLAPICTILGLAFRLFDPDGLLGEKKDMGITCALVPSNHPGVETGRRHFPLNAIFMNGPTRGNEVFMPLDFIIGGSSMAGKGWRMLMECLSVGRSISLPAANAGMARMTTRSVGAYCRIRSQFGTAVGLFQGVEEALARIGGHTYVIEATRTFTVGAVDLGEKPSVASAIAKYHITERGRQVANDGMDVVGGKGICLGPSNFMGRAYQQIPIGITVEGANILTRSLIIFGQGSIRCHPYALAEMQSVNNKDATKGLKDFDRAFWGHCCYFLRGFARAFWLSFSAAYSSKKPTHADKKMGRYYQKLARMSSAFSFLSEIAILLLGSSLKRRESLSARLGDALSQMYLASAVLKRYEDEGRQELDLPLAQWAIEDTLYRTQLAMDEFLQNFPNKIWATFVRRIVFFWGKPLTKPSDYLGHKVASLILAPNQARDRLTHHCYLPDSPDEPIAAIENALGATIDAEAIQKKLKQLVKSGVLANNPLANVRDMTTAAQSNNLLSQEELLLLKRRDELRNLVIKVDDFSFNSLFPNSKNLGV